MIITLNIWKRKLRNLTTQFPATRKLYCSSIFYTVIGQEDNIWKRNSPLALSQCPRGDDPQRDHEDQKHRTGADGHQGLEDEPGVKVNAIQGPYASRRRVREEFRVQQHHPADEVEPEEHRQREGDVVWYPLGADVAVLVRQFRSPQEVVLARDRVERADQQLPRDLHDTLPGHRDPPVVRAVIDHEQLLCNYRKSIHDRMTHL